MSSPTYAAPLHLKRYPSVILAVYIATAHGGVLVLLPWLDLPWELIVFLSISVFASFYFSLQNQALLSSPRAVVQIIWDSQSIWFLHQRNGIEHVGKLLPSCFVGPRLMVLNFVVGVWWRRVSVILLLDNIDPEALRRLQVRLRIAHS
jgi:toxin CptA